MEDWIEKLRPLIEQIEQDAWMRGYNTAVEAIVEQARASVSTISFTAGEAIGQLPSGAGDQPVRRRIIYTTLGSDVRSVEPSPSIIELTYQAIHENPGHRGTQIVDLVSGVASDKERKSIDRSVRTALLRLKERGKIVARDNRWFVLERELPNE